MSSSKDAIFDTHSGEMIHTRYGEVSGIQAEKIQKLRVNRVAIIQALKVEHVIPYLFGKNVLTHEDRKNIQKPKASQDKARKLLDILPFKGRQVDWFGAFRDALQCPDTRSSDIKKRYAILVEFLDNTILPSQERAGVHSNDSSTDSMKLPKYEPLPSIGDSELSVKNGASRVTFHVDSSQDNRDRVSPSGQEKGEIDNESTEKDEDRKQRRTLLKGLFHKWVPAPESFTSLIREPEDHFEHLRKSSDSEDHEQLLKEEEALKWVRNMEIVFALDKQQKLPEGFEICMSSAAEQVLADSNLYHLYLKYFEQLKSEHLIDIPLHLAASFVNLVHVLGDAGDDEIRDNIIKLGFGMFDLLKQYGMYNSAEKVMTSIVIYLSSTAEISSWLATYESFVKLMSIRNENMNFADADSVYNAALQVAYKIELMSFGNDLLSKCKLHTQLSILMREQGSISPAYVWAQDSLKGVQPKEHKDIVDSLCNATLAYGNKLLINKAEELAIHGVKYAKTFFGTRHPTYLQSLINYCHYSSEYRQDDMGIEVARKALEICEQIYGDVPSIQKAQCHQMLARALVVNFQFTEDEYYEQAMMAWRMAISVLPGTHPRLALFRYTLAQCLLWRATHCEPNQRLGLLTWAETECSGALARFRTYWGEFSLKVGQTNSLLGQIYTKMERLSEAQTILQENVMLHELSLPRHSHFTHLARASLGTFYKSVDKPLEGLELLQSVVDNIDCGGVYLKWVHVCYDTIIDLLNAVNREKDAEIYQSALVDWMKKNPKPSHQLTWQHLHATPESYEIFLNKFDAAGMRFKLAKDALKMNNLNEQYDQKVTSMAFIPAVK